MKSLCLFKISITPPLEPLIKLIVRGDQWLRAKSTDRDKLTANKLTANQRFRHSDFVTVIWSQSERLGKMALGIVKYFYDRPSQPIGVI